MIGAWQGGSANERLEPEEQKTAVARRGLASVAARSAR